MFLKEVSSAHYGWIYSFLQSLCYYFQNLDVIFHNSRHKTNNQWSKCTFFKTRTLFSIAWIQYT